MKKFFYGFKTFFKETDKLLFCLCSATSIFGILMVMSATRCKLEEGQIITRTALVMIAAVAFGIVLSLFISFFDYRIFTKLWPIIGVVCVGLMVALFFFGKAPILRPDSKIWLSFGPVDFQPSELLKIGFIITFGVHLEKLGHKINNPLNILGLAVHAIVPTALVVKTGDMGSALVFLVITAIMLFIAGIHWGYFVGGIALIGAASPLIWTYVLQPLQRDRFLALINPDLYPAVIYQQKLGLNAIGAGGFNGQGLFKGAYTQGGVVPESQNDMIFSVIGEELGFIGCTIALLLLTLIVIRMIYVGKKSSEQSTNFICCGMAAMIAGQVIINIGMCLMLLPVVGITLPFFSSGGSSNLCIYIGIGLVLSIYRHNCEQKAINLKVYDSLKK